MQRKVRLLRHRLFGHAWTPAQGHHCRCGDEAWREEPRDDGRLSVAFYKPVTQWLMANKLSAAGVLTVDLDVLLGRVPLLP